MKNSVNMLAALVSSSFYDLSRTAEVKVFDCIMEDHTVKLTDHYPNLIDVLL